MALVLKIRLTTIDDGLTYFQYDDENDTLDTAEQYGQSGNPIRADLGLFLYVTKKEVGDDVDSIVYDAAVTYVLGDITYYQNQLYKSLQAGNLGNTPSSSSAFWQNVTNDKDSILASTATTYWYFTEINDVLFYKSSVAYAKEIADNSKNGICKACDHEDKERLDRIDFHLQATGVADYQQLYTQAQYNVETLKFLTQ